MNQPPTQILRIDLQRCNGCGQCIAACPAGALALVAGHVSVVRPQDCTYTAACELACPIGAIQLPMQIVGPAAG